MKSLIVKGMVIIGIIAMVGQAHAVEVQELSDAELEEISAGNFLEMIEGLIDQTVGLADQTAALVSSGAALENIHAVNSATSVLTNLNCNVVASGDMLNINSDEVINQAVSTTNILSLSGSTQALLCALVNVNAVNSATCVQTNFNYNVTADSITSTNRATVINSQ